MEYQYADLSNRLKTEIKRLETQISRDTGRRVVLIAYEGGVQPTPVFGDVLESAPPNSSATSSDRAAAPPTTSSTAILHSGISDPRPSFIMIHKSFSECSRNSNICVIISRYDRDIINLPTPDERNTGRTPAGPAIPLRGFHILFLLLLFSLKARRHAALLFFAPARFRPHKLA